MGPVDLAMATGDAARGATRGQGISPWMAWHRAVGARWEVGLAKDAQAGSWLWARQAMPILSGPVARADGVAGTR